MALTSLGDVWAFTEFAEWVKLGDATDPRRTDVSAAMGLNQSGSPGLLRSIMVTNSGPAGEWSVLTYRDGSQVWPTFIRTGPYRDYNYPGGLPIVSPPIAVSSDLDHNRVWIVTADHRVYYGD
jgi:hypothetical protein